MALNRDPECGLDLSHRDSLFASLTPGGIGAEIGVDWGDYSRRIMELAQPRLMFLIDVWCDQPAEIIGHDPANSLQDVKYWQCLQRYTTDERYRMVKFKSPEIASVFPDGYFDWAYIDANHLLAYEDATAWWKKIRPGGILMGHDYCTPGTTNGCVGDYITVKPDIDRWVAEMGLKMYLTVETDTDYHNWIVFKK